MTPVSQPSGLGELTASTVAETDKRLEAIQRAQVGSLMEANQTKEPQEKTSKNNHPPWLLDLRSMPWSCGWKLKLMQACTPTPRKTITVLILQLTLSTVPIQVVLACTWGWLAICWPSMARRLSLGLASSMIRLSLPVKQSLIFPPGWDTLLDGECNV